ncbi:sugar phosphate isomerase/epimerase [Rhodohalobacter sp. SW132]|uniref:sugar phosphate isomerase/epimerase family protein n=1 Tax=Rhodohalobacter sp. SW132 TaxID=2293433 RepID=UPI000E21C9F6|nr:sugar phosphate isomerase/epimerase [Rhodohalobacter sp. SW132]REL39062.1 sugar phosphate isomerase/epimerase [Rhodohalobacter sp. SW132]
MKQLLLFCLIAILAPLSIPERSSAQTSQEGSSLLPDPGVVSYTFRNQFSEDVPGTLDMIQEMGFTNIEFSALFGKSAEEIRMLLDARDMICTSYGVGYDRLMDEPEEVAAEAEILGAEFVRVAWIPHSAPFDIDDAKRAISEFESAGKILREKGIRLNYHNHGYEFRPYEDGTLFDYMVQNSNPDYLNFELDTFWVAHPGHDPVELLKTYPDRFNLVHLKDLAKDAEHDYSGRAPSHYDVPLGTGQIDFHSFLIAAENSAIEHFYIEDETEDVVNRVPKSREYIIGLSK